MRLQHCVTRPLVRIALAASLLTLAPWVSSTRASATAAPCPAVAQVSSLASPVIRAGLDAEALAAAGLGVQEVSALVSAVNNAVGPDAQTLALADAAYSVARGDRDALSRKVKSGLASDAEVTALQAAEATLTAAENARAAALVVIFDAGTGGLSAAKTATLAMIQQNRAWGGVPIQYMVTARTEPQWVALVGAVANKKIAVQFGEPPLAACTALLAQVDAESAVAAAKVNTGANLAAVQAAWNAALAK